MRKEHDYAEFITLVQELQNAWEKKSTFAYMLALQKLDLHFKQHIDEVLANRQITYVYDLKKNNVDKAIIELEQKIEHMHNLREQAVLECSMMLEAKKNLALAKSEVTHESHHSS